MPQCINGQTCQQQKLAFVLIVQRSVQTGTRQGSMQAAQALVSCSYLRSIICVCTPHQQPSIISQAEQDITQAEQLNDASTMTRAGANSAKGICSKELSMRKSWSRGMRQMNNYLCSLRQTTMSLLTAAKVRSPRLARALMLCSNCNLSRKLTELVIQLTCDHTAELSYLRAH